MSRKGLVFLFGGISFLMNSCGIPNLITLTAPTSVVPSTQLQGNSVTHQLIITQPSGLYDPTTGFAGYDIYYRIYSQGTGANLLNNDNSQLTNYNPTVSQLVNQLGYKLLVPTTNLNSSDDPTIAGSIEPTIKLGTLASSALTFTIDFSDIYNAGFLNSLTSSTSMPGVIITCSNSQYSPVRVYRNVQYPPSFIPSLWPSNLTINNYSIYYKDWYSLFDKAFWVNPFVLDSDMYPGLDYNHNQINIASGNFGKGLEIDFFIAAYAWTPDQGAIYSRPIPLGIIYI
ncbi:MAG: hypothetical protein HKM05_11525 [Spirochaetales bacterium]|nr:hypothetical protein [Spirochaetales bacterium]